MAELKLPTHVGLIMDGNRRWAKFNGKKAVEGHLAGANNIITLAKHIFKKGIKALSIYAFSTENFKRDVEEVSYLMNLIGKFFNDRANELNDANIKVVFSGRGEPLKSNVLQIMAKVTNLTKDNTGGTLNVCLNYGGRTEIIDAVNKIQKTSEVITEASFSKYLYQDLPDIDLVIRTSGENRLSNFMLWQVSYAEFYFPKVYFPDFDEIEFDKALAEYNKRIRRFGGN